MHTWKQSWRETTASIEKDSIPLIDIASLFFPQYNGRIWVFELFKSNNFYRMEPMED